MVGRGLKRNWRKLALGCGVAGLTALAFCWGRSSARSQTMTPPPARASVSRYTPGEMVPGAPLAPESRTDYCRRVVAYIFDNVPITREDLGEYLIARYGVEKVQALVNHRIVDRACKARGIHITDAEVDAALAEDLRGLGNLSLKDFETKLLKPRNTTLFQWKEDVVRPKLALAQYCRDRIRVSEADLHKAFENRYGPKVACRMIVLPNAGDRKHLQIWTRVHTNDKEGDAAFEEEARHQSIPALAARGGEVPPICKNCGADQIEKEAFSLKPGEVSKMIATPDGDVILKCVFHIPADTKVKFEDCRVALEKEIRDQKIMMEIPKLVKELRAQARPKFFFKTPIPYEEFTNQVKENIQAGDTKIRGTAPHAN
jgi:hypothetical protein